MFELYRIASRRRSVFGNVSGRTNSFVFPFAVYRVDEPDDENPSNNKGKGDNGKADDSVDDDDSEDDEDDDEEESDDDNSGKKTKAELDYEKLYREEVKNARKMRQRAQALERENKKRTKNSLSEDEIKAYRKYKEDQAKAEENKKRQEGKFEELLGETKKEYEKRLAETKAELEKAKKSIVSERKGNLLSMTIPKFTTVPIGDVAPLISNHIIYDDEEQDFRVVTKPDSDDVMYDDDGKPMKPEKFVEKFISERPYLAVHAPKGGSGSSSQRKGSSADGGFTPADIAKMSASDYAKNRAKILAQAEK